MSDQIEPGRHKAKACRWGYTKTNSGSIQIGIEFDFLDLPGRRMTYYGNFNGGAAEHTFKAMRACGWAGEILTEIDDLGTNEVSLVVDWDEYQGKRSLKIKWVNPGGLAGNPVDVAELAEFAHNMIPVVKAVSPGTRKAPEPQAFGQRGGYSSGGSNYGAPPQGYGQQQNDDLPF